MYVYVLIICEQKDNKQQQQKLQIRMNSRDIQFLTNSFPRYYGRIDTTKIDIKQMTRFIEKSGIKKSNPFLAYSIQQKSDQQKRQDVITFTQLMNRINAALLNKNDSMAIQTILQTLDADEDGFVSIADVMAMNKELGTCIDEVKLGEIMEKITDQGTKISKAELANILF